MNEPNSSPVAGIALDQITRSYAKRGLAKLSDQTLIAAASAVVAHPRTEPGGSFVLHAPLELAARAALLPMVAPESRELARMRIVSIAAQYEAKQGLPPNPTEQHSGEPATDALGDLLKAVGSGDLEQTDSAARVVASSVDRASLVQGLTPALLPLTGAAAHAPIFLYHLARRDSNAGLSLDLVRPLARSLARNPDWRLHWLEGRQVSDPTDAQALNRALSELPLLGPPGSGSIHPLLMQVEETGLAKKHMGPVLGQANAASSHLLLRSAARLMLLDNPAQAPYGWSHCLTMPQAVLGITEGTPHADLGLAVAATYVAAFRVGLGKEVWHHGNPNALPQVDPTELATEAAIRHDAHLVKYTLACLDAAKDDPQERALYLAAGKHLLDHWRARGVDSSDPL